MPIGIWRDKYENGREVDMAGTLFRKHEFTNVVEFKDAILAEKDRFTRASPDTCCPSPWLASSGRPIRLALDEIAEATAADDYRIQTLIKQVILSEPFQSKTNPKTVRGRSTIKVSND